MTLHDDIEALRKRLAKAESDRDAWRAAGSQDKYLAAYFAVEALERQLDERWLAQGDPAALHPPQGLIRS